MREVLWLIVETVGSLLAAACVLRLWMVWQGMALRDPVGHFVFTFTEWLVRPIRAIVPRRGHFDGSCLLAALLCGLLPLSALRAQSDGPTIVSASGAGAGATTSEGAPPSLYPATPGKQFSRGNPSVPGGIGTTGRKPSSSFCARSVNVNKTASECRAAMR